MSLEEKTRELDEIAGYLRHMDDRAIYDVIGDRDVPEEAKVKLYGLIEKNDELADNLNQAAEILREEYRDE